MPRASSPRPAAANDPPFTNPWYVRFVARLQLKDRHLNAISAILLFPLFLFKVIRARFNRTSWGEVGRHLFSIGPPLRPPPPKPGHTRIVVISDTHCLHDRLDLPQGDVLVHCGDFTNFGTMREVHSFCQWLQRQPYKHKIVVPGNHDIIMDAAYFRSNWRNWNFVLPDAASASVAAAAAAAALRNVATVLVDSSVTVAGVRIHGSPWVETYGPWRTGFNRSDVQLQRMWQTSLPAEGTCDVLVTHSPPYGVGDRGATGKHVGARALADLVVNRVKPLFHVFGHVHSDCGVKQLQACRTTFVNASCCSDFYHVGCRRAGHVIDVPVAAAAHPHDE